MLLSALGGGTVGSVRGCGQPGSGRAWRFSAFVLGRQIVVEPPRYLLRVPRRRLPIAMVPGPDECAAIGDPPEVPTSLPLPIARLTPDLILASVR
jgi:hypothetical protein